MDSIWRSGETEGQVIFDESLSILNYASPDPHDGVPANIDPEHQKQQEEVGRLELDDEDYAPAGDMDPPETDDDQ